MVLENVHIPQEAKEGIASLLKGNYNSIISKSAMDLRRTNLFPNGYPNCGTASCMQTIPDSIKVWKVHWGGNKVVRKFWLYIQTFKPWTTLFIMVAKMPDPLKPNKQ